MDNDNLKKNEESANLNSVPKNASQNDSPKPVGNTKKLGSGVITSIVIISVLAGLVSGAVGSLLVQKDLHQVSATNANQTVINEDSAIIDVVKNASPAVVSIIVSKDLNQIQNGPSANNPFFFDPFFQFNQPNQNQPTTPNTPNIQQVAAGSGFFISSDGLIMTNKHVVSDAAAQYTVITSDGKSYDATVVSQDPINDLALVKIKISNAPHLDFADSNAIQIGQRVIAIGNSLGQYSNTVTTGVVSGIGRNITAGGEDTSEQLEGVIQTDAAINPGNSGGPLLDIDGKVIGINTAIDQQGQLVGFAIPSLDVQKDIQSYQKVGKITKPFLGIRYVVLDQSVARQYKLKVENGAWVTSQGDQSGTSPIVQGSAADKAGIKDGDIITVVNGTQLDQNTTLAQLIKNFNPGDIITLTVLRADKTINLKVTLGQK